MKPIATTGFPFAISSTFWLIVGLIRFVYELFTLATKPPRKKPLYKNKVAVVIAAHNEELVIRNCVRALKKMLKPKHIYVVSDGSTDNTVSIVKKEGCTVLTIKKNKGKAKAMLTIMKKYKLFTRYPYIFSVDADTQIDKHFLDHAIPYFEDPNVAAVFGAAKIKWKQHWIPQLKYYFIAYRERLNRLLQHFYGYGQTWKYFNATYVAPGFCTIFRSNVLKQLELDTPGLLIEDFHTAFQIHKKKLGRITYHPDIIGWDQHPETLWDYVKQVRRWNIGFFQTVRRDGVWPSFFWLSLATFTIEVFTHSLFLLAVPFLLLYLVTPYVFQFVPGLSQYSMLYQLFGPFQSVQIWDIIMAFFIVDYGLTVLIAVAYNKPQFLFYGLFFFVMHYITALILVSSVLPGFLSSSAGRWTSPKRSIEQMSVRF